MAELSVFYDIGRDATNDGETVPLATLRRDLIVAAVTEEENNFIGLVDVEGTTLQAINDGGGRFHIEIPVPPRQGSFATELAEAGFTDLFMTAAPPLTAYAERLGMEFQPW